MLPTPLAFYSHSVNMFPANVATDHPSVQPVSDNSSMSSNPVVQEIVQFWKNRRDNWTPPSQYIRDFKQIFRLHKLRDLMRHAVVVMETLFPNEVKYRFETVTIPREPPIHVVWCRWPGRQEWIEDHAASVVDAQRGVAMKAVGEVLGLQLLQYCLISASINYVGLDEKALSEALAAEGLYSDADAVLEDTPRASEPRARQSSAAPPIAPMLTAESTRIQTNQQIASLQSVYQQPNALPPPQQPSPVANSCTSTSIAAPQPASTTAAGTGTSEGHSVRYFSDSILKMNHATWKKLGREEREQVLFDFWVKTSWGKGFPWTMNLLLQRNPTGGGALPAFMLLFSEGRNLDKKGVKWITKNEKGSSSVECIWHDQWNEKHRVRGTGKKLDYARIDAAQKALKIIFSEEDLEVLQHVHSPFIYDGSSYQRVNVDLLWDRLKEAKLRENKQHERAGACPGGSQQEVHRAESIQVRNTATLRRLDNAGSSVLRVPDNQFSAHNTEPSLSPAAAPAQEQERYPASNSPTSDPPPSVTVTQESSRTTEPESPSNPPQDCQIDEYFSNNEDGTLEIPEWVTEMIRKPSTVPIEAPYDDSSSINDAAPATEKTDKETHIPYLPFDRIIAYEYPQEAAAALQLLFEGSKQTKPKFDTKKYVLAEVQVGSQFFQALGTTEEEAQEAAAAKALDALADIEG